MGRVTIEGWVLTAGTKTRVTPVFKEGGVAKVLGGPTELTMSVSLDNRWHGAWSLAGKRVRIEVIDE